MTSTYYLHSIYVNLLNFTPKLTLCLLHFTPMQHELHSKNAPILVNDRILPALGEGMCMTIHQNLTQFYLLKTPEKM